MRKRRNSTQLIAGAFSGAVATSVTMPLDLVKTVLQQNGAKTKTMDVLREVVTREGYAAAFKGLAPSLVGIIPQWGIYFPTYNFIKDKVSSMGLSQTTASMTAAVTAGSFASVITNPVWVVKTRMQALSRESYPSMIRAAQAIMEKESMRGFFKGLSASIVGVAHIGIQFPLYEALKRVDLTQSTAVNVAVASTLSKIVASSVTYPHEVVRTRMQCQTDVAYKGLADAFRKIKSTGGVGVFYRGMLANMVRSVPASVITLGVYEVVSSQLDDNFS